MAKYSQSKIGQMLRESDGAPTSDLRGEQLELLMCYIFCKIAGISFHEKNVLDRPRAHELDVVFWNVQPASKLFFLDPLLIIECKNTAHPVGSSEVRWFIDKLRDRGANSGVLVSLSGITGSGDGESSAHSEVLNALVRDRIKIFLLSREEIVSLTRSEDLIDLIREKYLRLTLDRTVI